MNEFSDSAFSVTWTVDTVTMRKRTVRNETQGRTGFSTILEMLNAKLGSSEYQRFSGQRQTSMSSPALLKLCSVSFLKVFRDFRNTLRKL